LYPQRSRPCRADSANTRQSMGWFLMREVPLKTCGHALLSGNALPIDWPEIEGFSGDSYAPYPTPKPLVAVTRMSPTLGFGVQDAGCRVQGAGCRIKGPGSRIQGQRSRVQGERLKVGQPQPSTLNPQPSTLHPQPSTLNPPPSTLNPQPSTLHPQPQTPNPRVQTPTPNT